MREVLVKTEEFKDSPVGRIPKDWRYEKLQYLCKTPIRDFGSFSMTNLITFLDSGIPFLKSEMIEEENLNAENLTFISNKVHNLLKKSWVYPGNILYSKIGSALGKAVLYKGNLGICNSNAAIAKIDIDETIALPAYVVRVLNSREGKQRLTKSIISLLPRINLTDLYNFEIALPPREEQKIIAEILDTVDDAIARTSSLITKLKQIKAGLLHDLLTRGLDENGKLRDAEAHPEQFKDSQLGQIPKDWEVGKLSDFYAVPARNGLYKPAKFYGRGALMIHMPQMFRGLTIDVSDAARVEVNPNELERYRLEPGDLVFARRSLNLEGAGRCSLVSELPEATTFESSIIRVRLSTDKLRPIFANHFLNSDAGFRLRLPLIRQVAVSGVSSEDIASIPVPCPQPKEQDAIVKIISSHNSRIRKEEAYLNKLKLQKQGLMHDLLTGKVRVNDMK